MEDDIDIRASLEAAMVEVKEEPKNEKTESEPEKVEPEKAAAEPEKTEEPAAKEAETEGEPEKEAEKPTTSSVKPPASWKAGAKERWATLSPDVQEEIVRRERDYSTGIQRHVEASKFAQNFHQAIEPFRAVMAAEGVSDPIQAVRGLMQTASSLRLGTPIQKAHTVAQLIKSYGVDLATLDSVINDGQNPDLQRQTEMERLLAERMRPYEEFMRQQQQQQQYQRQTVQQQAAKVVEEFAAKAEFIDDPEISGTMADLLEVAAKHNRSLTIEDAYSRAVQLHPEYSKVMAQRQAAKATSAVDIEKAKRASSSVRGGPTLGTPGDGPDDIRSALLAAMDSKVN